MTADSTDENDDDDDDDDDLRAANIRLNRTGIRFWGGLKATGRAMEYGEAHTRSYSDLIMKIILSNRESHGTGLGVLAG